MRLDGKSAVVTDGASGIGRAVAARFADAGARIVVLDRDEGPAREVCAEIGGGARFVRVDLRSVAETDAAFAHARTLRLADGPDEVHRNQIARLELKQYDNTVSKRDGNAFVTQWDELSDESERRPRFVV